MSNQNKPDPYNGFKNDAERRRALNVRAICVAIVRVVAHLPSLTANLKEIVIWLMKIWFQ